MYHIEVTFKVILDESRLSDPTDTGEYVLLINTSSNTRGFILDTDLKDIGVENEVSFHPVVKVRKLE